ncbi:MAG: aminotransferase class I/II-fold pyridoxal phosphate-dependent enzyme [Pseudonocardiaceae bacterium]|nr:aminotransferase class I/II-fold pyridoxal phosphate-dependent enzyme [Pseudonocardiaceae bacterium]
MDLDALDVTALHARIDALDESTLRARRTMKWTRYPPDVLPAWVAEMDYPLAPAVLDAARDVLARHDLGYPEPHGLAEAFARWASQQQGWQPDPAHAVPVADVMAGLEAALRVLTEPGDAVVLATPAYPPFFALLDDLRRRTVDWPLRDTEHGWMLDLDMLSAALAGGARAVLLCHPHNPVGRVWSPEELHAVAELADTHDAHVISDEVHAPLLAAGTDFTPYARVSDTAVTVTSISKGWNVPGLKCALLQAQPATAHVAAAVPERERLRASVPGVAASIAAWTDDGGWLAAVRDYLDRTRAELASWLAQRPGVRAHAGQAGFLTWLDLRRAGLGDDPAAALLERGRVALNPGHHFAGRAGDGHARLNHATSLPLLREVLRRIDATLDGGATSRPAQNS